MNFSDVDILSSCVLAGGSAIQFNFTANLEQGWTLTGCECWCELSPGRPDPANLIRVSNSITAAHLCNAELKHFE